MRRGSPGRHRLRTLVTALRHLDPREAVDLARLAATRADAGVPGFGLAADESLHPPEPFADAFALARAAGLIAAPHAGELAGPASVRPSRRPGPGAQCPSRHAHTGRPRFYPCPSALRRPRSARGR
ncbi:hypothetical protein [Streptomyces umbrinus]|uniref:hypothetical protein n=1 Tax=Streptomyces umbrinus TaxID=67370 RepID=UPI00359339B4